MTIREALTAQYTRSGGRCGAYFPQLRELTGLDVQALKNELNAMYKRKEIRVRPGSRGQLIFSTKKLMKE